jgi:hypothetical protein
VREYVYRNRRRRLRLRLWWFVSCSCIEDVPEDGPPFEEEASRSIDGHGIGGDLALGHEGLSGVVHVALHQVVVDVHIQHLVCLPIAPRHLQAAVRRGGGGGGGEMVSNSNRIARARARARTRSLARVPIWICRSPRLELESNNKGGRNGTRRH